MAELWPFDYRALLAIINLRLHSLELHPCYKFVAHIEHLCGFCNILNKFASPQVLGVYFILA